MFELKKDKPYILIKGKQENILLGVGREKNEEIHKALVKEADEKLK